MRIELSTDSSKNVSGRRSTRVQSELKHVTLFSDAETSHAGEVVDESFGGIGLRFADCPGLRPGQEVEISYNGVETCAVVRHSRREGHDGYRIGLQWKAEYLANEVRELNIKRTSRGDESPIDSFVQMLPGGIVMMWKFFEAGKSLELMETTGRLQREGRHCGIQSLNTFVDRVQTVLADAEPRKVVREALCSLIDECMRVAVVPEPGVS